MTADLSTSGIIPGHVSGVSKVVSRRARKARENAGGRTVDEALAAEGLATPLQRLTTPEDVARAVLFLASDLASGVTGHIVPVGSPFI